MRVTSNLFPDNLLNQLNRLATKQTQLQNQAAIGQRVSLPEDDPGAMRRVLDLQSEAKRLDQYQQNIAHHQEVATATYDILSGLKKISDRAGEIATLADGLRSPGELQSMANEVTQLIKQGVQFANGKNRGDYLLSGTQADQSPFVLTTDADGRVTSVNYQGNTDLPASEIAAGVTITSQSLGANNSGAGPRGLISDDRAGADFFNHLIALQDHLLAGDTASISQSDFEQLGKDEDNFLAHLGINGAVQTRLEAAADFAGKRSLQVQSQVSDEVDVDLADTLVRLSQTQTAYQAALQSGANILNTSLLDYLR